MPSELPTSIRLPAPLKNYLRRAAKEQHQKVSLLIVNILDEWCQRRKGKAPSNDFEVPQFGQDE